MDFSKLLSKEINKKRKNVQTKKNKVKKSKQQSVPDSNNQVEKNHPSVEVESPSKIVEEQPIASNQEPNTRNETPTTPRSKDETDIPEEQLNAKLSQFGQLDNSLSKEEKVNQLQLLLQHESKNTKYKQWLDQEAPLYQDPSQQLISLDLITNLQKHKQELYLKIRVFVKELIKQWEKHPTPGNNDEAILHETKRYIVKLLYKLRTHKLNDDMLTSLSTIIYYIQQQDYRKANESYMKLSIGNVAWPIGVLNVGIHARSSASRITGEKKSANIMIDEKTRRWITSVKRLITAMERINSVGENSI
ncbi:uncharacterized protein J8A68_003056 [[Candida] subhashii]|uniref:Pre-mRNA-splicing factor 18 n=1 Tax=[Candida] subhashii TaxID=561895 RepID=A0A8J5QB92_9ASCO|nr:uncharacterized protein J8A68_003056 [[Candida] subhashii]KAG7663404.1 hypothetical protein J8A68_003056 [[Candida] subhashii]